MDTKKVLLLGFLLVISTSLTAQEVESVVKLEEVTITSQHGSQHLLDIPAAITTIGAHTLNSANIGGLEQLAGFVPGLNVLIQTPGRPNLVIRGLTSDEVSPSAQPRVSVYLNHAPISRATMAVNEIYDMERVEVLKGPQGTLFGRGSQAGAIHFITRRPTNLFGGYVTAGAGDFGMMHIEGALNVPVTNELSTRFAGIYSYRNGYVKNLTDNTTLNGKNTAGGRFSLAYAPQTGNFKADLMVNYQNDNNPGTAFINDRGGIIDVFDYEVFLDRNKKFFNRREVLGAILNARYYTDERNYFSSITSYFYNTSNSRFDGDGTSAPALDMEEVGKANQFMQEFRYNLSWGNRISGVAGASFWCEDVSHTYLFRPDEQYAAYLVFQMPKVMMYGNPMRSHYDPNMGITEVLNFPNDHEETNITDAVNSAFDFFFDATYKLLPKWSFTVGVRATFERFSIKNRAYHSAGAPSVLGQWFVFADIDLGPPTYINSPDRNAVNFFFYPVENDVERKSSQAITWRANLKYDIDEHSNVFVGYSRGRRPNVLQYNSVGEMSIIDAESLHSFDAGYRLVSRRIMFDLSLYYQGYNNFQSSMWEGMNYIIVDAGKATLYGAELSGRVRINRYIDIFGNYAFARATFDEKNNDGKPQAMAGRSLRLTPRNSFLVGFNANVDISQNMRLTFTPTYSWQSHIWFEDANDPGIEQDAYGLLNANLALRFVRQRLTVLIFGANLIDEKYLISAGNMGAMFGIPTFVPGAPRMIGGKLMWNF